MDLTGVPHHSLIMLCQSSRQKSDVCRQPISLTVVQPQRVWQLIWAARHMQHLALRDTMLTNLHWIAGRHHEPFPFLIQAHSFEHVAMLCAVFESVTARHKSAGHHSNSKYLHCLNACSCGGAGCREVVCLDLRGCQMLPATALRSLSSLPRLRALDIAGLDHLQGTIRHPYLFTLTSGCCKANVHGH